MKSLSCESNHLVCVNCLPNFFRHILSEPETLIPPKCAWCQKLVDPLKVEQCLNTPKERELYFGYLIEKELAQNGEEILQRCPHCSYYEIWPANNGAMFFECRNDACLRVTCTVCNRTVSALNKVSYPIDMEEAIYTHGTRCFANKELKERWDKCLKDGQNMYCPKCGYGGRKDLACTHISCTRCGEYWCYICGIGQTTVCPNGESFYTVHNSKWETKEGCCPQYFKYLQQLDPRWTRDEFKCMERFHHQRTLTLLKKFVLDVGVLAYKELCKSFPEVEHLGFSLSDIMQADTLVIWRKPKKEELK